MKKLKLKQWVQDTIAATIITIMFVAVGIVAFKVYGII